MESLGIVPRMAKVEGLEARGKNPNGLRRWRRLWFGSFGVVFVLVLAGISVGFFVHPKSGHRHTAGLIVALVVVAAVIAVSAVVGWRLMGRDGPTQQLMESDWRTRRRVGIALRKGRAISENDRPVARATIDYYKKLTWLPWLYVGLGILWLINTALAHGNRRWFDLGLAILYLSVSPFWFRMRKSIISRDQEIGDV